MRTSWQYWVGWVTICIVSTLLGGLIGYVFWYIGVYLELIVVLVVCFVLAFPSNMVWIEFCKRRGWYRAL